MLSLIEVKCPHCGARGQITSPPVGSIIVGPCPECQELVVVFCGQVLPLKREIMLGDCVKDKRDHLMAVLTDFIRQRVIQVVSQEEAENSKRDAASAPADRAATPGRKIAVKNEESGTEETRDSGSARSKSSKAGGPISQTDLESFLSNDLRLIDNANYFKAIFG